MHDLDRSMFESPVSETAGPGAGAADRQQFQALLAGFMRESESEYGQAEYEAESQEFELATELLEVGNEAELDRFIGNLFNRVAGAARHFARSDTGRALGGIVKSAIGQALPVVGRAAGSAISPSGGDLGARVGKAASDLLGLELESLSAEDRELAVARALIRFAQEAARQALTAPHAAPAAAVARAAAATAAQQHAPGLLPALITPGRQSSTRPATTNPLAVSSQNGRWVRDERGRIVLLGV